MSSKLSERTLKVMNLALAPSAIEGEWHAAAIRFFFILRKEKVTVESLGLGKDSGWRPPPGPSCSPPPKPEKAKPAPQPEARKPWHTRPPKTMPFGRHKGEEFPDIPSDYLAWLKSQEFVKDGLREAVEKELAQRAEEARRAREESRKPRQDDFWGDDDDDVPF